MRSRAVDISRAVVFCLLALNTATVTASFRKPGNQEDPRPWMQELRRTPTPTIVAPGVHLYEKNFERTNRETGEHLSFKYSVRVEEDAYIQLNDATGLMGIKCETDSIILTVDSTFNLKPFWSWDLNGTGRLLYGGRRHGCNNTEGEIAQIFRSIASLPSLQNSSDANSQFYILIVPTRGVSPFSFFGR